MNIKRDTLSIALSLFAASAALGGSKGFTAVFIDVGASKFYESDLYSAFRSGFPETQKSRDCWESRATGGEAFELIIRKKLPEGLTQEMAQAIYSGDIGAAKKAQAILANARPPKKNKIDGMYIINANGASISVMALGARGLIGPKNPSRKVVVPWNESDPRQGAVDFDLALCSVSKPLDVGFGP